MIYKIMYENQGNCEQIILKNQNQYTSDEFEKLYDKIYYQIEAWYEGEEQYDGDDYETIQCIIDAWDYSPQEAVADYMCEYYGFFTPEAHVTIWV